MVKITEKWYEQVKLNEVIYHVYEVLEKSSVNVFATSDNQAAG